MSNPVTIDGAMSSRGIVAQNLLIARNALDLTQQEVADASGVSRGTIAQLEAGLGDPRLSTLELLAETLHTCVYFLLMDQAGFRALAELVAAADTLGKSVQKPQEQLVRQFNGRRPHNRTQAAAMGLDAIMEAGLDKNAHKVGAAIGAARLAAEGTFLGAHLAFLLERFKPPTSKPQQPEEPGQYQGEGI